MSFKPPLASRFSPSLVLCLLLSLLFVGTLQAQDTDPEKEELILKLLDQTGQSAEAVGQQMASAFVQQMTMALKQAAPDTPPETYDIVEKAVTSTINEEMEENDMVKQISYPIYDKHFTVEDLRDLVAFYDTPTGKKAIQLLPVISQESMVAGQQWGMSLVPKIQERVENDLKEAGLE